MKQKAKYLVLVVQLINLRLSQKKKKDYNAKINEIGKKVIDHNHDKYITTLEFNKFTAEIFATRSAQANFIPQADFDTKLIGLIKK